MLRDLLSGKDEQATAISEIIAHIRPDILVLQNVDYDYELLALRALGNQISDNGHALPYAFARRPNTGLASGVDLDGDGRSGTAKDAHGFGSFSGQGGMAVLSRYAIDEEGVKDFSDLLWKDLPDANLPMTEDGPFPSLEAQQRLRLAEVGHWVVPVTIGERSLQLLTFHSSPPVFDGPEDRNGRRNHDQMLFWRQYLDGGFGPPPDGNFVLAGNANIDPHKGEGRKGAIQTLLSDPRLQNRVPNRVGKLGTKAKDGEADTVDWPAPGPGKRRVSYILPSSDLHVTGAGVFWPKGAEPLAQLVETASRHRLVWIDIELD